jgi:hypothetical protein
MAGGLPAREGIGMKGSFESWMATVNGWVMAMVGLSVYDMSDCCFRDWWEDGMSPKAAARRCVRHEQGDE